MVMVLVMSVMMMRMMMASLGMLSVMILTRPSIPMLVTLGKILLTKTVMVLTEQKVSPVCQMTEMKTPLRSRTDGDSVVPLPPVPGRSPETPWCGAWDRRRSR